MRDLLLLVVPVQVAGRLREGFIRAAAQNDATFPLGHRLNRRSSLLGERLTGHPAGHHHLYDAVRPLWRRLREAGIAAPIDDAVFHYVLVGAASLPYVNAPEARVLTGAEPTDPAWVERHAAGARRIAMLRSEGVLGGRQGG